MNLFAYGTLCHPEVIRALIGRVPASEAARLANYRCGLLRSQRFPGIVSCAGQSVTGLLYVQLRWHELRLIKVYEDRFYKLCDVALIRESDDQICSASTFVIKKAFAHLVTERSYDWQTLSVKEIKQLLGG